jgi:hypothetical protein
MEKTYFSESIASLIILQKLYIFLFVLALFPSQGTFKETIFDEIHTVSKLTLSDDDLVILCLFLDHAVNKEILFLFVEISEKKSIGEVKSDHNLCSFLFYSSLAKTYRFPSSVIEHAICL